MTNDYFMVLDKEKKNLLNKFNEIHPDGGDLVFKLLLKFYIKFASWHRKKGRNPINAFEDLIERELKGGAYSTDLPRLRFLNEVIEKGEDVVLNASDGASSGFSGEMPEEFRNELKKEISGLKELILTMKSSGGFGRPADGGEGAASLDDFKPSGAAVLTKVGEAKPKKRKNYRDLRTKEGVKKIDFND
ncbi:MAG: hypothetical protein ACUZ8O_17430 [Candidatus Anammoxibacter sp.]